MTANWIVKCSWRVDNGQRKCLMPSNDSKKTEEILGEPVNCVETVTVIVLSD